MLGSGISGAAPSMNILVAGRVLQGVGGGGISVLCNVIVCDMFPLKQRGMFLALIMIAVSLGTAIGPFLGGGKCSILVLESFPGIVSLTLYIYISNY